MAGIQQVSFTSPYAADEADIERRRRMAEMLQQKADVPLGPTETVGGWAIRKSPWEGLAKVAQGGVAGYQHNQAEERQKALSERYQNDYQQMVAKGLRQLQGTPAQAGGDYEDSMGIGRSNPGQPAAAPDPMGALATFGSHPMGAQFAPLAMQQLQRQQMIQALRGGAQPQGGQPMLQGAGGAPMGATAPQGQGAGVGGPAQGIPMEMWLQIDPSGKSYMEALAKQNTPVALREGDMVAPDGQGGYRSVYTQPKLDPGMQPVRGPGGVVTGAQAIPGYSEGRAGIAGAQASATGDAAAARDMVTINTPQGPVMMTRAQALQLSGGTQAPGQPVPQAGGLPAGAMVPSAPGKAEQLTQPIPAADMPAFNAAIAGRRPGGIGIPLQDQGSTRTEAEIGAGLGKRYTEIQDAGFAANNKINKISRLGSLLESVSTGKLSPAGYEVAAYMKSMGLPVTDKLGNAQAATAAANEFALELRNPSGGAGMPGAMSDSDRSYLQSLVAGVGKDPGANKQIIEAMTKVAERERDVARIAREYKKKKGSFDEGFFDELDKFSKENPLFGNKPPAPPVSQATKDFLRSQGIQVD